MTKVNSAGPTNELFGSGTVLVSGKHAANGYMAMAGEDVNQDGELDALDASFKDMRIWVDANHDGKTDAGKLKLLADYNIAELNLDAARGTILDHGNLLGLVSSYTKTDGSHHAMADVWFAKDVTPAHSDDLKAKVSISDVLAPPSDHLLVDPAAAVAKAAVPELQAHHQAMIDRRLLDDDEFRRNNGPLI